MASERYPEILQPADKTLYDFTEYEDEGIDTKTLNFILWPKKSYFATIPEKTSNMYSFAIEMAPIAIKLDFTINQNIFIDFNNFYDF